MGPESKLKALMMMAVARISTAKFFPNDEGTKAVVTEALAELCGRPQRQRAITRKADCARCKGTGFYEFTNSLGFDASAKCDCLMETVIHTWSPEEQVEWLSRRFIELRIPWNDGLNELRAVYCSRFTPPDGKLACSGNYPDGFPLEAPFPWEEHRSEGLIAEVPRKRVAVAETTADVQLQGTVAKVAKASGQHRGLRSFTAGDLADLKALYPDDYDQSMARLQARKRK
jgi:hypothetical protein